MLSFKQADSLPVPVPGVSSSLGEQLKTDLQLAAPSKYQDNSLQRGKSYRLWNKADLKDHEVIQTLRASTASFIKPSRVAVTMILTQGPS